MDRSKEINSLEGRATKLAWQQSMPPLSMPVYFEDEEPPKQYGVKLPDGSVIPLTLPIKIERKKSE